jgi:chromosome segregation ATPase
VKVDPEALEREAEELQRKLVEELQGPTEDTPAETPAETPGESPETVEQPSETPHDEDRGDPDRDDGDAAAKLKVAEERLKNAQARMTKATQEAADLRRDNAALRTQLAELNATLSKADDRQEVFDDELKTLAEEYPDIAKPLIAKLSRLEEQVRKTENRVVEDKSQGELKKHFDSIRQSHPDMDEIVVSDDFTGWLERQTPLWQRVAQEGSAAEVVELLDRYKQVFDSPQQPESKVERARRVAEPTLPKVRKPDPNAGKRIWTRDEIRLMSLSDFEKHQADIDRAYLEGRVR